MTPVIAVGVELLSFVLVGRKMRNWIVGGEPYRRMELRPAY